MSDPAPWHAAAPSLTEALPKTENNLRRLANARPATWQNPAPAPLYNLVVIGAGSAGLVTAIIAASLGGKVALIEKHMMGGDCLNVGCVPSKALIRSARLMHDIEASPAFGLESLGASVDFGQVMERVRRIQADISPVDSVWRYQGLGVDVFLGEGRFSGPTTVEVAGAQLNFKKAVIATGSRPIHPTIPGLAEAGFLTNEVVFNLTEIPQRLAVIGGGPIGCELAQAFRRLGSTVTLIHSAEHILNREDSDVAKVVQDAFVDEGITLLLDSTVIEVTQENGAKIVHYQNKSGQAAVTVDAILVAAGRAPNIEGLGLELSGVQADPKRGVLVDDFLRTANPRIYAAGDVAMRHQFTHAASAAARIVIQNAFFFGRKKVSDLQIPWCTYTDPEIAHVGMSAREAQARGIEIDSFTAHLHENDRAVTDGETRGFVRLHVRKGSDKLLGATIVARNAGDMINEITLAMTAGIGLSTIANVIHPYPTQAEAIVRAAGLYTRSRLTPRTKKLFEWWMGLRRRIG